MPSDRAVLCQFAPWVALGVLAAIAFPRPAAAFPVAPDPCQQGACGTMVMAPPPAPSLAYPGIPIPAGGAILLYVPDPTLMFDAVLRDELGVVLETERLEVAPTFVALRPLTPLVAGTTVNLRTSTSLVVGDYVVGVTAPASTLPLAVEQTGELKVSEYALQECCGAGDPTLMPHCYEAALVRSAQVTFSAAAPTSAPSELTQYVFQLVEPASTLRFQAGLPQHTQPVTTSGVLVCAQVLARHIVSLEDILYPEVCVEADTPPLGSEPYDTDAELSVDVCARPPAGRTEDWCRVNGALCTGGAECGAYGELCLGEPPAAGGAGGGSSPPPLAGMSAAGMGAEPDPAGFAGSTGEPGADDTAAAGSTHVSAGCGACSASPGSPLPGLFPGLLALWLYRRRRH